MKPLLFLAIIIFSAFIYIYNLENYPASVHCDEISPAIFGQQILNGQIKDIFNVTWLDIPNLTFTPYAASIFLLGNSIFAVRFPSVVISILSLVFFFLLVKLLFNKITAFIAVFLLSTSHWWIASSRTGLINFQTVLPEIAAFYFIFLGLGKKKVLYFILGGLSIAVGLNLYVNFRLVPLICLSIFFHQFFFKPKKIKSRFELIKFFSVFSISAIIFFLPMINFYLKNPEKYLSNTYSSFLFSPYKDTKLYMKSIYQGSEDLKVWLLGNIKKAFDISSNNQDESSQYGYRGRILEIVTLLLFLLGQIISFALIRNVKYFFLCVWFWSTYIGLGILTTHVPFLPRLAGVIPAVYIFSSITLDKSLRIILKRFHNKYLRIALHLFTVIIVLIIALKNLKIYFIDNYQKQVGNFKKFTQTAIPQYIQEQNTSYKIVFVPEDYIPREDMCLFNYFYSEEKIISLKDMDVILPISTPVMFIIREDFENKIPEIVSKYPGGVLTYNQFPNVHMYKLDQ